MQPLRDGIAAQAMWKVHQMHVWGATQKEHELHVTEGRDAWYPRKAYCQKKDPNEGISSDRHGDIFDGFLEAAGITK